jgi:hypothetical protein
MKQGRIYIPKTILPPGQVTKHFIVVLTSDLILKRLAASQNSFAVVAIIRSAVNQSGRPVPLVPMHSVPISPSDVPNLTHDSIIETHQLFHMPIAELNPARNPILGDLPKPILAQVLSGARALLA